MATTYSPSGDRRLLRRRETIDQALELALEIMAEVGVGGLTISEIARRMGVRAPSLYKYFPSLHAVYDELFARGTAAHDRFVQEAIANVPPGVEQFRQSGRAIVRWCVENPAQAQLLYWRVVPGFEPSPEAFAASVAGMRQARADLTAAVELGQLAPAADSDDALRLFTVLISGLISQQMANEPGATYETGRFTRLTDEALDMFFDRYKPRRP